MKFDWNSYFEPTPKKVQKIGIAFKAVSGSAIPAVIMGSTWVGVGLFVVGMVGELLSNLFTDDTTTKP